MNATRSPAPTPAAARAWATWLDRASSSAKVRLRPPASSAGASGRRAPCTRTTSARLRMAARSAALVASAVVMVGCHPRLRPARTPVAGGSRPLPYVRHPPGIRSTRGGHHACCGAARRPDGRSRGRARPRSRHRPGPGEGAACGICGSDLHFARHGATMLALADEMRGAPETGSPRLDLDRDVFMGHELAVEVVEAGPGTEAARPRGPSSPRYRCCWPPRHPGADLHQRPAGGYSEHMLLSALLLLTVPNGLDAPGRSAHRAPGRRAPRRNRLGHPAG